MATSTTKNLEKQLGVRFYRSDAGNEPVKDWITDLHKADRKVIGADIKTVQIGWPLGMPLIRKMTTDLWELRIALDKRIARILFTVVKNDMVLLHAFIKKTNATPQGDLDIARERLNKVKKP